MGTTKTELRDDGWTVIETTADPNGNMFEQTDYMLQRRTLGVKKDSTSGKLMAVYVILSEYEAKDDAFRAALVEAMIKHLEAKETE